MGGPLSLLPLGV